MIQNKKHKILITGVNGFIGSHLAGCLREDHILIGIDTDSVCPGNNVDFYLQMVLPSTDLDGLIKTFQPEVCIHCAGSASVGYSLMNPGVDFNAGPPIVFQLLDSIRKSSPQCRFIFLSSAAVYGNPERIPVNEYAAVKPISPYGYHKKICEEIIAEFHKIYGIQHVVLRVFSCYGCGLRKQLLWDISSKISSGTLDLFGTGNETRDFIHVADLARIIGLLIDHGTVTTTLNIGSGTETKISELVSLMVEQYQCGMAAHFNRKARAGDPERWAADTGRLRECIGEFEFLPLRQGVANYCEWYKRHGVN